jgi:3',5'-cyclic AMP phosphodiesterase CpdA
LRPPHKILTDAAAFRDIIAAHGAELILHGHDHMHSQLALEGPRGEVPLVGLPSASSPGTDGHPAAWNLYRIGGTPGAWTCEMETRGLLPIGTVSPLEKKQLIG